MNSHQSRRGTCFQHVVLVGEVALGAVVLRGGLRCELVEGVPAVGIDAAWGGFGGAAA
jgi:hypothetical protein